MRSDMAIDDKPIRDRRRATAPKSNREALDAALRGMLKRQVGLDATTVACYRLA